ncbi:MAG: hypothetical protein ABIJ11_04530 [Elusimicrobiota bacterium]
MNSNKEGLKKDKNGRRIGVDKVCWAIFFSTIIIFFLRGITLSEYHNFRGEFNLSTMVDGNVYKDSRGFSDIGLLANLGLGMRSKISRHTFTRLDYRLDVSNFFTYNLENEASHLLDGRIKQRLGDLFDVDLNAGISMSQMPKAAVYNSSGFYAEPSLNWYIFDYTKITGGYIYNKTMYPSYNLDNETTGGQVKLGQELSLYTYIEISGVIQNKNYPERYLYSGVSGGSPTYKTDVRKDAENFVELIFSQNITAKSGVDLIYYSGKLESNENYFDWGPGQYEGENTITGDERIIENYRSWTTNKYGMNMFTGLDEDSRLFLQCSYAISDYAGRLAKDENDAIRRPEVKRQDTQIVVSASYFIDMFIFRYTYEINNSNDALYKYTSSILSAGIRHLF